MIPIVPLILAVTTGVALGRILSRAAIEAVEDLPDPEKGSTIAGEGSIGSDDGGDKTDSDISGGGDCNPDRLGADQSKPDSPKPNESDDDGG